MSNRFPPVLSKKDFVSRFMAGEFGNKGPNWGSLEEWEKDARTNQLYHLRSRKAGDKTFYNVKCCDVEEVWKEHGCGPQSHYLAAMAPHNRNLLQGEVMQTEHGLYLFYSTVPDLPMRDALQKENNHVQGLRASSILRYYMNPTSWDWLQVLLYRYPFHVIEISVFDCEWGTVPYHNTVFWEVRNY